MSSRVPRRRSGTAAVFFSSSPGDASLCMPSVPAIGAGRNRIHTYTVVSPFQRQDPGQLVDAGLRCASTGLVSHRDKGLRRGDVDDRRARRLRTSMVPNWPAALSNARTTASKSRTSAATPTMLPPIAPSAATAAFDVLLLTTGDGNVRAVLREVLGDPEADVGRATEDERVLSGEVQRQRHGDCSILRDMVTGSSGRPDSALTCSHNRSNRPVSMTGLRTLASAHCCCASVEDAFPSH